MASLVKRFVTMALVGAIGCASNPTRPSPLPLGRAFELRAGASANVEGGLTMAFQRVTSDSRCPMDALCVWAGDAVVVLAVSRDGQPATRELHTNPPSSEASYAGYTIKLVSLAPYPRSDRQIRPDDYVATLLVAAR